jgi:hypothetical protein
MKKTQFILTILILTVLIACVPQATTTPTIPVPTIEIPTTTPEVFISVTQAIPTQIQLNGILLAIQEARVGDCDLPDCPPAPAGRRYLSVTLQSLNLPEGQSLDYKNLPVGIAIYDDTGNSTPFERLYAYKPAEQQLIIYFAVPEAAMAFSLQWPEVTEIPLSVRIDEQPTVQPTSFADTVASFGPMTLVVPPEVANGVSSSEIAPVTGSDAAWWQKTPGHTQIDLGETYILQDKTRRPRILVYPAQAYAELVPAAFESMHRLNNILGSPSAPISTEQLPALPFLNEIQTFAANIEVIRFQNGQGVRFLSEYGQSATSANNQDLFYQFQGLTDDGKYYIAAIFPITSPDLSESNDPAAAVPIGGVEFPSMGDLNADWAGYYSAVTELLNATPPEDFYPAINQLDALIQSMQVTP